MLRNEAAWHRQGMISEAVGPAGRAVSLFCGAGGFCAGVQMAGFSIACAVENDEASIKTHEANFHGVQMFASDIAKFLRGNEARSAPEEAVMAQPVALVFGGPPCQGFSQIGPRNPDDPRNQLYRQFVRVVGELRPAAFIMENVPNMLSMDGGAYRKRIVRAFKARGYARQAILDLKASDYGVPQERRRIFVVGVRDDIALSGDLQLQCEAQLKMHEIGHTVSVWQAISDLPAAVSADDSPLEYPQLGRGRPAAFKNLVRLDLSSPLIDAKAKLEQLGGPVALHNHHTKGMEIRRRRIVSLMKPGMTGSCLPRELWKGVRSHKWRRLSPDKPSYTILAQMARDLSEWIHPFEDRWITVREAARLQSFHDGFRFVGSEYQQLRQVGNAVPPLLGYAVASSVRQVLAEARTV